MGVTARQRFFTEEEYLLLEARSEQRSEFFRGEIFALAGGSVNHSRIARNAAFALSMRGRSSSCETFTGDMRLLVEANGLYTYPDAMVVCGSIEFVEGRNDTITNPVVIVEVLSPSTAAYDRGQKFELYRGLAALRDYLLIHQDRVLIEHYHKQKDGRWLLSEVADAAASLAIATLDAEIPVAELYARVDWFDQPQSQSGS